MMIFNFCLFRSFSFIDRFLNIGDVMYKLVVSSFDKTLIDDDFAIPISTVLTIDSIRRRGCKFVVATNRGVSFIKEYIKDVNFIDYIASLNGSYIYDVMREKVIYDKRITLEIIRKIIKKYKDTVCNIYLCTDHSKCILKDKIINKDDIIIRDFEDFIKNNKVYKIEIHTPNNKTCKKIEKEIKEMDIPICMNVGEYEDKDYLVEITANNINKCSAIEKICNIEKISLSDVLFIGSSYNDLSLIKKVGQSVSTANSISEVKKKTSIHTSSNNEKGVEKIIKKMFEVN